MTTPPQRLVGCAFLMEMAGGAVHLGVQFAGVALGAEPKVLGLLGAISAATYTVLCLFSGRLADRVGPRWTSRTAVWLLVAVWLLMARAGRIGLLLGLMAANGALLSLFWPGIMAWLASLTSGQPRQLGRVLGLFNLSWSLGALLGAIVAGMLWDLVGKGSFYGIVSIAVAILILLQLTPEGRRREHCPPQLTPASASESPNGIGQRLLVAGRIAAFAGVFGSGIISSLFPKLGHLLGYSSSLIGGVVGIRFLGCMTMFAVARTTTHWHYRPWALRVAIPTGIVGMTVAALARSPQQFMAGFLLVGLCTGVAYLTSQFYGLHGAPERRGVSMGYHEATVGAGFVLGPICGGLLADYTGNLRDAFALGAAVMLIAGVVQLAVWWAMARRS